MGSVVRVEVLRLARLVLHHAVAAVAPAVDVCIPVHALVHARAQAGAHRDPARLAVAAWGLQLLGLVNELRFLRQVSTRCPGAC